MAAQGKTVPVEIVIRTTDRATAQVKAINERIERSFKPLKDLRSELGRLYENSGLKNLASGIGRVGGVAKEVVRDLGIVAAAAGAAVYGFKHLVDEFDELGDVAERAGVSVDFLAQLRAAAEEAGSSAEELDAGMSTFTKTLGQAEAKTGKLYGFLKKVSPELLKQVRGAKSNEEAFDLMANAIAKIPDPARRAALATAAFGGAGTALAPLLGKGKKGIDELRAAYFKHAGSQKEAADAAQKVKESLGPLNNEFTRLKAEIVVGVAPAFIQLTKRATEFLGSNKERIAEWIKNFGERLPGAIAKAIEFMGAVKDAVMPVIDLIRGFVDVVGGGENAVKLLVAAWVAFKALKLAGAILEIVGALGKMAVAATAAGAAAEAAGGGGTAVAGSKLGILKYVPHVAAVTGGAALGTYLGKKAGTQRLFGSDEERLQRDALGSDRDSFGRHRVASRLGITEAELDKRRKEGEDIIRARNAAIDQTRSAAAFVRRGRGVGPLGEEAPLTSDDIARLAAALEKVAAGGLTVDFKNAPPGTRVEKKSGTVIDYAVGYIMGGG